MEKLANAFARFHSVLRALEAEENVRVRWVLADLGYGSATATARAEPLDEDSAPRIPAMTERFVDAARQVAAGASDGDRPLLRVVRELASVADEANAVTMETADDEVIFTAPVTTEPSTGPRTLRSLGSVRGRVETLSHRKGLRFTLYELTNDRPVSCYLQPGDEDLMRDAWGRVADVTGVVTREAATGRPLAVRHVSDVQVVMEGDSLGFLLARGAVGGTEPAERVLRRVRDAG